MASSADFACAGCGSATRTPFCSKCGAAAGPQARQGARRGARPSDRIFTQTRGDIAALWPLLIAPFRHLRDVPPATRRVIALVSAAGILPLAVLTIFSGSALIEYWGLEFYFTLFWAGFFVAVYRTEGVRVQIALATFFFTGIIGMGALFLVLGLGLEALRAPLLGSQSILIAAPAFILFVGLFEEATKAAALFVMGRFLGTLPPLRVFVFYGLISGLSFGVYEGIKYQTELNVMALQETGDVASYYLTNVLRLTSLPFLHAVWTAIAAFLIWFGFRFPKRRLGFFTLAIAIPAVLHGLYDALSRFEPLWALLVAALSIAILSVYIASADDLQRDIAPLAEDAADVLL